MSDIHALLLRLGIPPCSYGFLQTAYAVSLALEKPEILHHITKCLYPDVAKHYHTSAACVERNIRSAVECAWERRRDLLIDLSCGFWEDRPTASEFLAVVVLELLG